MEPHQEGGRRPENMSSWERTGEWRNLRVDNNQPQIPPSPALPESPIPLEAPPETFPGGKPDGNSLQMERVAQGLPPTQVAPSVEHLYEGHLGEVTKGWGSDLTIPPHQSSPSLYIQ